MADCSGQIIALSLWFKDIKILLNIAMRYYYYIIVEELCKV